jgi:hypothetical protein
MIPRAKRRTFLNESLGSNNKSESRGQHVHVLIARWNCGLSVRTHCTTFANLRYEYVEGSTEDF